MAPKESTGVARPLVERAVKSKAEKRESGGLVCKEVGRTDGGALTARLKEAFGSGGNFRKCMSCLAFSCFSFTLIWRILVRSLSLRVMAN